MVMEVINIAPAYDLAYSYKPGSKFAARYLAYMRGNYIQF